MQPRSQTTTSRTPRGGFTLLEMLLVAALLVAVAGITWPMMLRVYDDLELKETAETVRIELTGTRIHAVDSGLIYQFRYEPGGRRWLVVPFEHDSTELLEAGGNNSNDELEDALYREAGEIPEDLAFESLESGDLSEKIDDELLADLPDASLLKKTNWSLPLLFYPDGSATDAAFQIVDDKRQYIEISLRELTGAVTVDRVRREAKR